MNMSDFDWNQIIGNSLFFGLLYFVIIVGGWLWGIVKSKTRDKKKNNTSKTNDSTKNKPEQDLENNHLT